jgi:pimeloyl-ACP methyl ester carboxylesterase
MPARSIVLLAALAIVAGCGAPSATPSPNGSPAVTPGPSGRAPITLAGRAMTPCTIGSAAAVCGTLSVPEDRATPAGRTIALRGAVLPATGPTVRADPVVFLDGGPGGAATEDFGWIADVLAALHVDHDFVLVDQRGTGGSNRLVVPPSPDLSGLPPAEADAKARAWLADVLAGLPGDPRFYTTSAAMDDVDDVRAALGADRVDLIGPSYGATAAQYFIRQHPSRVRAAVFDGGTLVDVPIFERIARNSQRALDLAFARCAAEARCSAAYPDLGADLARALAALDHGPVTTTVNQPGSVTKLVIDRATFVSIVHDSLLNDGRTAALPRLIHAAAGGDWDQPAEALAAMLGATGANNAQLVMSAEIRCSEAWARFDVDETARAAAGSYLAEQQVASARQWADVCRFAPPGVVRPDDAAPVRSDVPVLLVLGEADPQNPPENVADASIELPNSRTVIVPGEGHTVGHLGCLPGLIAQFVAAGSAQNLDARCAATSVSLPPFVVP